MQRLGRGDIVVDLVIPGHEGGFINWLYEEAEVISRGALDSGDVQAKVRVASEKKERLAGPGPPRRRRLDAGADLTLRHVHIAGSKTKPTPHT